MIAAVLDVGGTSIKLGAVHDGIAAIGGPVPAHSDQPASAVLDQLALAANHAVEIALAPAAGAIDALIVAFPGPFDLEGGRPLLRGPKFGSIHGVDLRAELRGRVDLAETPIVFVRDSEAVGVGEAVFGAGSDAHCVLTVALGTGFGSCLTIDGDVVERVGDQMVERLFEIETPHGSVDDVLSARGFAALGDGGQAAREFGRRLGAFLASLAATWPVDIDTVVVAGGAAGSFGRFAPALSAATDLRCVQAQLGPGAALLGAALLGQRGTNVTAPGEHRTPS